MLGCGGLLAEGVPQLLSGQHVALAWRYWGVGVEEILDLFQTFFVFEMFVALLGRIVVMVVVTVARESGGKLC